MNLLLTLDAILREGSVSKAAAVLGTSQPVVSHKLNRLRDALGDPLLVRHGRGLAPTPRAQQLAAPLAAALEQLSMAVVPPDEFDPATAEGVIHLATQYAPVSFLPTLVDLFADRAPGLDLHVLQMGGEEPQVRLAEGTSDIVIQPQAGDLRAVGRGQSFKLSETLYSQRLYDDPWVVVVREGHPLRGDTMTPARFAAIPHILVSLRGDAYGFVDRALEGLGLKRRVALLVQNFMLGCFQVARTDYLMTTNLSIALALEDLLPLRVLPVPLDMPRGFISQVWHERTHRDPAQLWIRKQIYECGCQLDARMNAVAKQRGLLVAG